MVPAQAHVEIDVRVAVPAEADRVDQELRALVTRVPGTTLTVGGGPNRPPLPVGASAALFKVAQDVAGRLGTGALEGVVVGGGSDGNFTAAVGLPDPGWPRRSRALARTLRASTYASARCPSAPRSSRASLPGCEPERAPPAD